MYNSSLLKNGVKLISKNEIDEIADYDMKCAMTDFALLLGGELFNEHVDRDLTLTGRTCKYWIDDFNAGFVGVISEEGKLSYKNSKCINFGIRPVLHYNDESQLPIYKKKIKDGIYEILYGDYPQYVADSDISEILESKFNNNTLNETGKKFTINDDIDIGFFPKKIEEYEYKGKKYVRIECNYWSHQYHLSNGSICEGYNNYWVEVSPIHWILFEDSKMLVSKTSLISNIRFNNIPYKGSFALTIMNKYLNSYFKYDILSDRIIEQKEEKGNELNSTKRNPYKLDLSKVSEEEIIKGTIDSGVAVFLHGASSEGKSARVKQIDSNCVILYLGSSSPEALNGKSVYNSNTGEMMDVKPTWLRKLEKLCEEEPNKNHVVFFDELTNALPSIQSIAFNIVLDREVNGIWKLPENARIVAAGNEMSDSLSANQLAEPLFNRFAHVYIKTTTEGWLKWASENNIHPAIYAYSAYKKGETLRSEYDGEKPNADPRKWEMASNMLYQTGNPEMLRALVGEDITKEFVQFCNQQVITLEDVINGDYSERDIELLNTAERYATVMALSGVDENNLEKVRNFVIKLGAEFTSIFDSIWTHGDEQRLERLMEAKLADNKEELIR